MTSPMLNPNHRLLRQARAGRRLTAIWLVIPLTFVILFLGQLGAIFFFLPTLRRRGVDLTTLAERDAGELMQLLWPQTASEYTLLLISSFIGIYIFVGLWVKFFERRSLESLGLSMSAAFFKLGRGFGAGALIFVAAVVPGIWLGLYTVEAGPIVDARVIGGVLLILIGWLVQGPAEEFIFRGWVLTTISARYTLWLGVFLSSLLFAVAHSLNDGISLLAILNLALFGLFTALYVLWEEALWGVFSIHAVWNWVQGNIFGLAVSGSSPGDSLFVIQETGPDILTGGVFGPEGGLLVTVMLGVAIGCLFFLNSRSGVEAS